MLLDEVLENLECDYLVRGKQPNTATDFASLFDNVEGSLCWMRATGDAGREWLKRSRANIIICSDMEIPEELLTNKTVIVVANPHVSFMRVLRNMYGQRYAVSPGIHPTAIVSPDAQLGEGVTIEPFARIGRCVIGANSVVKSSAVIHDGARIGANVLIYEFCNIGGDGFGYIKNEKSDLENMLQIGTVVLEDEVHVFPYTNIDRGTLGVTRVGWGTKIDHFCHIGHNTQIGRNNVITPNVTTLGGVRIGDECMIGAGSAFRDGVVVGSHVTVGMGSVVTKNIPDHETWVGVPARRMDEFKWLQGTISDSLKKR